MKDIGKSLSGTMSLLSKSGIVPDTGEKPELIRKAQDRIAGQTVGQTDRNLKDSLVPLNVCLRLDGKNLRARSTSLRDQEKAIRNYRLALKGVSRDFAENMIASMVARGLGFRNESDELSDAKAEYLVSMLMNYPADAVSEVCCRLRGEWFPSADVLETEIKELLDPRLRSFAAISEFCDIIDAEELTEKQQARRIVIQALEVADKFHTAYHWGTDQDRFDRTRADFMEHMELIKTLSPAMLKKWKRDIKKLREHAEVESLDPETPAKKPDLIDIMERRKMVMTAFAAELKVVDVPVEGGIDFVRLVTIQNRKAREIDTFPNRNAVEAWVKKSKEFVEAEKGAG